MFRTKLHPDVGPVSSRPVYDYSKTARPSGYEDGSSGTIGQATTVQQTDGKEVAIFKITNTALNRGSNTIDSAVVTVRQGVGNEYGNDIEFYDSNDGNANTTSLSSTTADNADGKVSSFRLKKSDGTWTNPIRLTGDLTDKNGKPITMDQIRNMNGAQLQEFINQALDKADTNTTGEGSSYTLTSDDKETLMAHRNAQTILNDDNFKKFADAVIQQDNASYSNGRAKNVPGAEVTGPKDITRPDPQNTDELGTKAVVRQYENNNSTYVQVSGTGKSTRGTYNDNKTAPEAHGNVTYSDKYGTVLGKKDDTEMPTQDQIKNMTPEELVKFRESIDYKPE